MAELKHIRPETANDILCKVDAITQKICDTVRKIAESRSIQEAPYAELQEHIEENQQILSSYGLSNPRLDDMCSIAKSYGFAGKLTGFGGRFAYILLPPSTQKEQIKNLSTELEAKDFSVTRTNVGCSGVKID
ncbi:mevalonate kinase [Lasius niger]|uniref:Mevalonate kinase n=1 Tax=Lasius niger TaxID=67767 RepID=A0A0J7KJE7_LASNI|nr:mevalonate kinase [Lasius niger]